VMHVPLPIRQLLIAESASNDGLAYPFLSIAIYLTTEASRETAFEKWLVISWLCPWMTRAFLLLVLIYRLDQVILGTALGAAIGTRFTLLYASQRHNGIAGWLFSRLLRLAHKKGFLDRESYVAQYISLALFTVGATNSLGNDDLLAAFAAGGFVSYHVIYLLILVCRQCNFLGRPFQPTDRG